MSPSSPPLCIVTLSARSAEEARQETSLAAEAGADVAEIRFDRWRDRSFDQMARLFPAPLPLLATLRSRSEGGEGPDDPAERARWFSDIARLAFAFVDVEWRQDADSSGGLAPSPGAARIYSVHLAPGTPAPEVHRWVTLLTGQEGMAKVVVPASVGVVLTELMPNLPPAGEGRLVVHTTGPSGPLLRAWARRLGFAAVFAAPAVEAGHGRGAPVEPAQIPIDRLGPYLKAGGSAPLFAIVGRPVSQSRSPDLHHFWMSAEGRLGLYIALELGTESELVDSVPRLVAGGFRGLNITHPFKFVALQASDEDSVGATACGCANLLTFDDGQVMADNTDLFACLLRLRELEVAGRWDGENLLVVGAGGSARATLAAARELGVRPVVAARSSEAESRLASEFGAEAARSTAARKVSLLVHATPVGRRGNPTLDVDLRGWLGPESYVLDWVYEPDHPTVRELATQAEGSYEDGRRLLAYSAAASYGRWWGTTLPSGLVDRALQDWK